MSASSSDDPNTPDSTPSSASSAPGADDHDLDARIRAIVDKQVTERLAEERSVGERDDAERRVRGDEGGDDFDRDDVGNRERSERKLDDDRDTADQSWDQGGAQAGYNATQSGSDSWDRDARDQDYRRDAPQQRTEQGRMDDTRVLDRGDEGFDHRREVVLDDHAIEDHDLTELKTSTAAVFALVFGLSALLCALTLILSPLAVIFGLIGIILGFVGLSKAKLPLVTGRGVAIGGLVMSVLGLILGGALIAGTATFLSNEDNIQRIEDRLQDIRNEFPTEVPEELNN